MEASHASLAKPTVFFCNGSSPSRNYTLSTQFSRKPAKKLTDYSFSFLKLPSWASFATRRRAKLAVYSQFRRPPRRRNSLRVKHIPRQEQVLLFPEVSNPESNYENLGVRDHANDARRLGMDFDSEKESEGSVDSKKFDFSRNSVLWDKLDNWAGRYKEESEFWGIGAGPIFTIFKSSDGNVIRVSINEDEILKRSRIRALHLEGNEEGGELKDVNYKISIARLIAKEIEVGEYQMPINSSIARFVVEGKKSSLVGLFHAFSSRSESLVRIFPRIGFTVLCCFCVLGAVGRLFVGYSDVELTREEAEMLRRKKRSRMQKEESQRVSVEVLKNGDELPVISGTMPLLNRDELMKSIMQAKKSGGTLVSSVSSDHFTAEKHDFDKKVKEIRDMVRKVREVEHKKQSSKNHSGEQDDLSSIIVDKDFQTGGVENHAHDKAQSAKGSMGRDNDAKICSRLSQEDNAVICKDVKEMKTLDEEMPISTGEFSKGESLNKSGTRRSQDVVDVESQQTRILENSPKLPVGTHMTNPGASDTVSLSHKQVEMNKVDSNSVRGEQTIKGSSITSTNKKGKAKIITSLKEAKDYLSTKRRIHKGLVQPEQPIHHKGSVQPDQRIHLNGVSEVVGSCADRSDGNLNRKKDLPTTSTSDFLQLSEPVARPEITQSGVSINLEPSLEKDRDLDDVSHSYPIRTGVLGFDPVAVNVSSDGSKAEDASNDFTSEVKNSSNSSNSNPQNENLPKTNEKSWTEENFQQFDSVIKKIGHGFKDNYMLAKVKAQENALSSVDISKLSLWGHDEELEWMEDESLREIVFRVRENELAGQDPFHLMNADDQKAFFQGLERQAEKANEKLAGVHEWIHSRIENLDYGADGISLDDPLEKIIPRWKGPPVDQDPEFLKKFPNIGILDDILRDKQENFQKSQNLANPDGVSPYSPVNDRVLLSQNGTSIAPRTLIESSDGSSRPGKKKSKEHWQHTKKWSQGFLEVYNTETDPEVKSILKDMGKDLDRWITEKEKKDVSDLLAKTPKKKRRFIEKKMNKIKREVENYGAQAVISKYKEYADEKEKDYLWWLDLRFVLCIELYSVEDGTPSVGFYSLEMAEDLELNPKQFHVIAFEDPGDSKNFCHIVQAQMDMLGSGKAFVVARPPKDSFREAKANGFSITLIRKGEVKLNVDQTLEEVEEELKEVGSKIYHDKIMDERGVDIRSLMKGVMAVNKSSKRS